MDYKTALAIQFSGIFLVAMLLCFLAQSLRSEASKYWTAAWLFLAFALTSLYAGFNIYGAEKVFYGFYLLGEYAFAFLLIAGCRAAATGERLTAKSFYWLAPALVISCVLPFTSKDFNFIFSIHSFILGVCFAGAFYATWRTREQENFGWRVMQTAIVLLALNFFHYSFALNLRESLLQWLMPEKYLTFNSIFDLVLEIMLGFGMVIVLLEQVRREVENANFELKSARDQLERIAHFDPLTNAFNRHAFYGFLQTRKAGEAVAGCVGVFDVDNLKPINDRYGHAAGDVAIRAAANAIRSVIRADDMLFRWGGDEFFVVMFGLTEAQARTRMTSLTKKLSAVRVDPQAAPQPVGISFGFADFADAPDIEAAVKRADAEMYDFKQARKRARAAASIEEAKPAAKKKAAKKKTPKPASLAV